MKQLLIALTAILLLSTVACSKKEKGNNNNGVTNTNTCVQYGTNGQCIRYANSGNNTCIQYNSNGQCIQYSNNGGAGNHQQYCQYWSYQPQYQYPNFMQECLNYCNNNPASCY